MNYSRILILLFICILFSSVSWSGSSSPDSTILKPGPQTIPIMPAKSPQITKTSLSPLDNVPQAQAQTEQTFGEKMVEFIRSILGDKPKPIDETLVRDEL